MGFLEIVSCEEELNELDLLVFGVLEDAELTSALEG